MSLRSSGAQTRQERVGPMLVVFPRIGLSAGPFEWRSQIEKALPILPASQMALSNRIDVILGSVACERPERT
jgi:hypothetical protein